MAKTDAELADIYRACQHFWVEGEPDCRLCGADQRAYLRWKGDRIRELEEENAVLRETVRRLVLPATPRESPTSPAQPTSSEQISITSALDAADLQRTEVLTQLIRGIVRDEIARMAMTTPAALRGQGTSS